MKNTYSAVGSDGNALADKCITSTYLHVCDKSCGKTCSFQDEAFSKLWICHTCDRHLLKGKVPVQSVANNLHLKPIPPELECLNELEQRLISLHIPFIRLIPLKKGGQNSVQGPTVCVPSNLSHVTSILPRDESEDKMVRMKLKRKLTYKGHYQDMHVDTGNIKNGLNYLILNNTRYKDVSINPKWINTLEETENETNEDEMTESEEKVETCIDNDISDKDEDDAPEIQDFSHIKDQHGMFASSCLQPVDLGQEILDQHFDGILSIAPAEENSPIRLLSDGTNEPKCFPVLFPKGAPTFHDERPERITLHKYFNQRILNADGRFAQNTDYLFYAQYMSELNQILSNVSIALRKGTDKGLT